MMTANSIDISLLLFRKQMVDNHVLNAKEGKSNSRCGAPRSSCFMLSQLLYSAGKVLDSWLDARRRPRMFGHAPQAGGSVPVSLLLRRFNRDKLGRAAHCDGSVPVNALLARKRPSKPGSAVAKAEGSVPRKRLPLSSTKMRLGTCAMQLPSWGADLQMCTTCRRFVTGCCKHATCARPAGQICTSHTEQP